MTMMKFVLKVAVAVAIVLQMTPAPAHAVLTRPLVMETAPTIGDMDPGSCIYEGSGWYLCSKGGHSYGCSVKTGLCYKL
jgi:hypothetical protein